MVQHQPLKKSRRPERDDNQLVVVLVLRSSFAKEVKRNQDSAISILELNQVPYRVLDASDPKAKAKCDILFQISGVPATNFPQFFRIIEGKDILEDSDWDASTSFWGDYARFETFDGEGRIAKEFGGVAPLSPPPGTRKRESNTPLTSISTLDDAIAKQEKEEQRKRRSSGSCCNMGCFMRFVILIQYSLVIISIPLYIKICIEDEDKPKQHHQVLKFIQRNLEKLPDAWEEALTKALPLESLITTPTEVAVVTSLDQTQCTNTDATDGSCNNNIWKNPLPDKEFFAKVFGISGGPVKKRPKGGVWNDPFDWLDVGASQGDQERQSFIADVAAFFKSQQKDDGATKEKIMTNLLAKKTEGSTALEQKSFSQMLEMLANSSAEVFRQVNETLGNVGLERFNLLQFLYYMDKEETVKNSVWKRRVHRYQPQVPTEVAVQLYDGLYLSQLAYAPSCQEIYNRIQAFRGGLWTLRNCTVEASVEQPAHFVLVRKVGPTGGKRRGNTALRDSPKRRRNPLSRVLNWLPETRQQLEVALVIRGTKEVFDFLTDGRLLATDYRGGKAHEGILRSAHWLEELYRDDLKQFWENSIKQSGFVSRKPMKLWLIGHSLGGGAAALTAMQFREPDYTEWLDAEALGFGTPSVVSPELSYQYQDYITTVVNDADVVPRTSGRVIAKAWLKVASFNWTDAALEDFDQLVDMFQSDEVARKFFGSKGNEFVEKTCRNIRQWLETQFHENVTPWLKDFAQREMFLDEKDAELIPPGECIHFYRDGINFQANYMNCSFFNEIELVRHFVDDHLIPPGYYRAILGFVREKMNNVSWSFQDNILDIAYE